MTLNDARTPNGDDPEIANWIPVAKRLRQVSSAQHGPGIVTLTVLIDDNGKPRIYTVEAKKIEPRAKIEDVIRWLSGDK